MNNSINQWLAILREFHTLVSLPLLVGGAVLCLFGWRMWRFCVAMAYAVIGVSGAVWLMGHFGMETDYFLAGGAGLIGAVIAFSAATVCLPLLGGIIGAGVLYPILSGMGLRDVALWVAAAVCAVGGGGLAFINRRYLVISVTSFFGATLVVSGLAALLMNAKSMYATFHGMAMGSVIVVPFMLLVPTVMSFFYQVADVRRVQAEL